MQQTLYRSKRDEIDLKLPLLPTKSGSDHIRFPSSPASPSPTTFPRINSNFSHVELLIATVYEV